MKILYIIPFFAPAWAWGGSLATAYELCKGMQARGHQITVYTTDSLNSKSRMVVSTGKPVLFEGLEIYYFRNTSNWLAGKHHLQFSPSLFIFAQRNTQRFDVAHLHLYRTFQNMMINPYLKKNRIPYVLQAHGTLSNIGPKQQLKELYDVFG